MPPAGHPGKPQLRAVSQGHSIPLFRLLGVASLLHGWGFDLMNDVWGSSGQGWKGDWGWPSVRTPARERSDTRWFPLGLPNGKSRGPSSGPGYQQRFWVALNEQLGSRGPWGMMAPEAIPHWNLSPAISLVLNGSDPKLTKYISTILSFN